MHFAYFLLCLRLLWLATAVSGSATYAVCIEGTAVVMTITRGVLVHSAANTCSYSAMGRNGSSVRFVRLCKANSTEACFPGPE